MKKDYIYLYYDENTDSFFIALGTGERSLTTRGWYRFTDDENEFLPFIMNPKDVFEIGKV